MPRSLIRLLTVVAIIVGSVAVLAGPAQAAGPAVATSVGLNADADCSSADLDIGLITGQVDLETGMSTDLAGNVIEDWSQNSGLDDENTVFVGYGIGAGAPDGTIIGSYASIGVTPLTPASAAEWFVLYECSTSGANTVLHTCFGDLGTCPTTALEGAIAAMSYTDVAAGHAFDADIAWLTFMGISTGYGDSTFRPTADVTRMAMGSFLHKYEGEPANGLTEPFFADVPASHPFYDAIQWMAESGRSTGSPNPGGGKPLYNPSGTVSRQALAAFMYRAAGSPVFTPPGIPSFDDVGLGHPFLTEIEWLASTGITTGYADGGFHPGATVTRQAMAAFIRRFDAL